MGTRADFYIGEGESAEWLGSVAWDGYEWDEDKESSLRIAASEADFREEVKTIGERDDFRSPEKGWPWPWDDSTTTDYAYCFTGQGLRIFCFGRPVVDGVDEEDDDYVEPPKAAFPNMKSKATVTDGGFLIFTVTR